MMKEKLITVFLELAIAITVGSAQPMQLNSEPSSDQDFYVYRMSSPFNQFVEEPSLSNLSINFNVETHLFVPGDHSEEYNSLMKAYFKESYDASKINLIFIKYISLSVEVGYRIGKDLNILKEKKGNVLSRIITHGRGALVLCGLIKVYEGKLKRVVFIDPIKEMLNVDDDHKVTKNSAEVVEVVHATVNQLGFQQPFGHRDFYPNGGIAPHPECIEDNNYSCNTRIAVFYYLKAFEDNLFNCWLARQCPSYENFANEECESSLAINMYNNLPNNIEGTFYLHSP